MKFTDAQGKIDWSMFGFATKSFINEVYGDATTYVDAINGAAGKEIISEYVLNQILKGTKQPNINQLIVMGQLCGVEFSIDGVAEEIAQSMVNPGSACKPKPTFVPDGCEKVAPPEIVRPSFMPSTIQHDEPFEEVVSNIYAEQ